MAISEYMIAYLSKLIFVVHKEDQGKKDEY